MILAQDGYGAADKIEEGINTGYLDGAIFSTKYRRPESLPHDVSNFLSNFPDSELFLDTHFYASQIAMTRAGRIPDYQLFDTGLTRKDFISPRNIENYSHRIIDYQRSLGLTNIIVPGLTINDFDDANSVLTLQLYTESMDYIKNSGLASKVKPYLSLVFSETALSSEEKLSQYLDAITLYSDAVGFYIIVERPNTDFPQWQDSHTLARLMYTVNALSSNYEVVCGFTDFPGILLLGAGAKHVASGWYQTLRLYTRSYFMSRGGGQSGKFRYPSKQLLTQLISQPDLQSIIRNGLDDYIDAAYGSGLQDPNNLQISPLNRVLLQWKVFSSLGQELLDADNQMQRLENLIANAESKARELRGEGIILDRSSIQHYKVWKQAIADFKNGVL